MRLAATALFFLLFTVFGTAQKIQVFGAEDKQPIGGVAVYNTSKSKSGVTDFDGFVDISAFAPLEEITFQHVAHERFKISKNKIAANNQQVFLQLQANALNEIVLSVSKFGQRRRDIPQQILSVTSEDVLFSNPQTAADLLESSGQVYVQKSQLGGGSPLIRGFSTSRLLIAVDGVRFNTAIFRGGNVQNVIAIDPFAIARTEVILGPGSVVYGSDAVGGVMNFYTKKPAFSFEDGISLSGNAIGRHATANNEKTGHVDFNIGLKEWAFLTSATYSGFDDLKMGAHGPEDYLRPEYVQTINGQDVVVANPRPRVQVPTGYGQMNIMQKVRYMPSAHHDFQLGLFYTTTGNFARYDRLIRKKEGNLFAAEWYYGPQEWASANLKVTATPKTERSFYDEGALSLSFQQFKESRNRRSFGDTLLFRTEERVRAYTAGLDLTKKFTKGSLFYGAEYVFNKVSSNGEQTNITNGQSAPTASRYPDGS
ncbi:MAG: TonB-dependent receptor, partial [Marinirhabdus sp.]